MLVFSVILVPFISVAHDGSHLEVGKGLHDSRSGSHALHLVVEPPAAGELRGAVFQRGGAMPAGPFTAEVWARGEVRRVEVSVACIDSQSNRVEEKRRGIRPSAVGWKAIRVSSDWKDGCAAVEVSLEARGPGGVSFDDAALRDADGHDALENPGFERGWQGWRQGLEPRHIGMWWVNDQPFTPWGLNYDRTIYNGRHLILEQAPLEKIDRDFQQARRLGANSIRIFLQLGLFMPSPSEVDPERLRFLDEVIAIARRRNLRVDLTGLSHIASSQLPAWYAVGAAEANLQAERLFWDVIAKRYADEPAILMFNLQNEPFISAREEDRATIGCFPMAEDLKFCYVNPHPPSIGARRWTETMVGAIRQHDKRHLVTIGFLPSAVPVFGRSSSGFNIADLADLLDVIAIHLYPDKEAPEGEFLDLNQVWMEMALRYAGGFDKPVIVEEWFPLFRHGGENADWADWFRRFMEASEGNVAGWFTFYHALLVDGAAEKDPFPNAQIEQFAKHALRLWSHKPARPPAAATIEIDPEDLWKNPDKSRELLDRYLKLKRSSGPVDFKAMPSMVGDN